MFFKSIDVFGVPILLYYKKELRARTIFGGILTTFIFGFIAYLAYYFSQDLINRKNPIMRVTEVYTPDAIIPLENMTIAINIHDSFLQPIKNIEKVFYIEAQFWEVFSSSNGTLDTFKSEKCDRQKHFPNVSNQTENLELNNFLCFDIPKNISLRNGFVEFPGRFFTLVLFKCQNNTMNGSNDKYLI